jgi:LysM repeat protein
MDNNDSNIKSQQTGGLKLMTVFIAVLALHVVVIGGFTVYHLMSGGSTDADLTTTDKTHKDSTVVDGTLPNASPSTQTATPSTEVATIPQAASGPANPTTPEADQSTPTIVTMPAPAPTPATALTPAPAPTVAAPAPALTPTMPPPPADLVDQNTPSGPISPELAPPAEPAPAPSVVMDSGPVHMPPAEASAPVHEHQQIYVVKITDSYKKIAHAHHITVAELKESNHIKGNVLHTGQKLVIPSERTLVATTTALDSSSTGPILSESAAPMTTNLAFASSTETTTVPHAHVYTVVKGDTLIKIAHKFKTTANALMAENSISDPTKLAIGKKLKIPSEESRSARNSAPSSTQPSQVQAKENAPSAQLANFVP